MPGQKHLVGPEDRQFLTGVSGNGADLPDHFVSIAPRGSPCTTALLRGVITIDNEIIFRLGFDQCFNGRFSRQHISS